MITQEYLEECFNYDSASGLLTWKVRPVHHFKSERDWRWWNTRFSSGCVTAVNSRGYIQTSINRTRVSAHRVIWELVYGYKPVQVDHINGDKSDNRLLNLREVTVVGNAHNQKTPVNNTSGCIGVSWYKGKWCASISVNRVRKHLGRFTNKSDAIAVRKKAEMDYGYHENHGRDLCVKRR